MYISVVLLCTALVCAWAWQLWITRRARSCFKHLPAFPTLPILGHTYKFLGSAEGWFKFLLEMSKKSEDTNLPVVFWLGPYPLLMCSNPDDVKTIFTSCVDKPHLYHFGKAIFGQGLLAAPSAIWKRTIKKLGSTLNTSVVNSYQNVFSTQSKMLANKLRSKVDGPPFDMFDELAYTTFEAICHTALGLPEENENKINFNEYLGAFNEAFTQILKRTLNPLVHIEQVYKLTPGYKKLTESIKIIDDYYKSVLRVVDDKEYKQKQQEESPESPKRFKSYLDILLSLKDSDPIFTPEQIKFEVNTIIIGGQETSATSLYFLFLAIGSRPEIQEKMYEELYEIFGDSDRPIKTEDLERMKYCEAVIMETLRLYPPLALSLRRTDKDLMIKSCLIPKGTDCAINILGAGWSRRAWGPDAMEFRPERWLNPDLDPTSFYAFSYGRRPCIGRKYILALDKNVVASLVREFRFTSNTDNMRLKYDIPLRAITGNLIQVHARQSRPVQITT